jgi:hypothetical protein
VRRRAQPREAAALARATGGPGRVESLPPAAPTVPPQRPRAGCLECDGPNRERAQFCQARGSELA